VSEELESFNKQTEIHLKGIECCDYLYDNRLISRDTYMKIAEDLVRMQKRDRVCIYKPYKEIDEMGKALYAGMQVFVKKREKVQ
jgi:hypothetical protein